jgi:hypothetical protein
MTRISLRVEECCSWCRRPVRRCTEAACDDAQTYSGILLRGQWQEVSEKSAATALQSRVAA